MAMINGKEFEIENSIILSDLLIKLGYTGPRIAVEVNGDIVPKAKFGEFEIKNDDRVEIVGLVGGG